ncbi:MAG: tetratricopeptide repeat protein [Acidobacteriia bacterium]|nr:tetratricopeptide repeat protein [Terriglobia bacterium]
MRVIRYVAVVLAAALALVSCSRDPNIAKRRYLESGNRYFDKGRYKEARIQYLNSTKVDARFGPGYYKLGLTDLKLTPTPNLGEAVKAFRRAIELLVPADKYPEHWDAAVKLSEIYLVVAKSQKQYIDEVESYCKQMLERDANSFDGHRLYGDVYFVRAIEAFRTALRDEGQKDLDLAAAEYRKADTIKPGEMGVMMQLARVMEAKSELPEAEALFRRVIEKDKTYQTEDRYILAKQGPYMELYILLATFEKKAAEGEQVLKLAVQNNPKQYRFLTFLAMHYALQNRRDDMLGVLQQIKSHSRDWDLAYFTVGDFYVLLGDGESALKEYREGLSKEPKKKVEYQKRIIEVLMREGKRPEAADVNAQILKDNPNDPDARGLAASVMLDKGDVNKALSELQAVVTRAPENAVARYNLGRTYVALTQWEQARQSFQKAIELRPDYLPPRLALAQLQVARGEFDAALKSVAEVLRRDRSNANALLIESAALMGQQRFGDARKLLELMLKANPSSQDVLFQLGVVNLQEKQYKEADDAFRRSYELNPANPRGLMGVVETYMAQNKSDEAIQLLQAELHKAPNRTDLVMAMGNVYVRAGRYDQAIGSFQKLLDSLDKSSKARGELYLKIGETYRRKGDYSNAVANLQKARDTLPDNVLVLSTLALVLEGGEHKSEAMQVYDAILKIQPDNPVILNNKAFLMAENNGDLDHALTLAQRSKQLMPNLSEISDTLGWIYLKKSQADSAITIFKELVAKYPGQSTYHYHLAMAFSQKGDRPRAIKELNDALKCNPAAQEKAKIQALLGSLG